MRRICDFLIVSGILLAVSSLAARAQRLPGTPPAAPPSIPAQPPQINNNSQIYGGYMVGVGDILQVRVADEDDMTGQYQVNEDGKIILPLLSAPIPAAGSTTFDLAHRIEAALKQQQILREPSVTVFILRGMSHNVTVLGAVVRPGVYPIEKPTTLLDLLSQVGGLQGNAGSTLTITTPDKGSKVQGIPAPNSPDAKGKIETVNIQDLTSGKGSAARLQVHAGDVVTVPTAPVVFVVGAVTHPGMFTVQDSRSGMTVLQAIAMAEGTLSTASLGHALIVRQSSEDAKRQNIPIDLKKVERGKKTDQVLQANDILFVPQSGFKAGLQRMGQIATQTAGQIAGYGLGLRLGY